MTVWQTMKVAWAYMRWGHRRKKTMSKLSDAVKGLFKSRTSQNVAVGTAVGGGGVYAAIRALRGLWPDLPGNEDSDVALAVAITTVVVPLLSRIVAFWRHPEKAQQSAETTVAGASGGYIRVSLLCAVAVAYILALGLCGCAVNKARFVEYTYDATSGAQTGKTGFTQYGLVFWGSQQKTAQGSLAYKGPDWDLAVGNASEGAQAGDLATTLQGLAQLGQVLGPIAGNVAVEGIKAKSGATTIGAIGGAATDIIGAVKTPTTTATTETK